MGGGASGSSGGPTLNFATGVSFNDIVFHCRFCQLDGHSSLYCPQYTTHKDRVDRCNQLKICRHCTSVNHPIGSCPGLNNELRKNCKFCNSKTHVGCLCPQGRFISFAKTARRLQNNVCLNTNVGDKSNYLLPVLSLKMRVHGGPMVRFNVLFDTASSRSYIDPIIAKRLGLKLDSVSDGEYEVNTFLGSGLKTLGEATLEVILPSQRHLVLPLLIDRDFKVAIEVNGLKDCVQNLKNLRFPLAAEYGESCESIVVNGLIGSDIIQYIKFETSKCMHGSALRFDSGFVPFGNSEHFLYPHQVNKTKNCRLENNFKTIVSEVKCSIELVNTCLEPKATYEDNLTPLFDESSVERRIDKMLTCDSMGLGDALGDLSDYDRGKIAQFEAGITIKDQVFVKLVWNDNVNDVPSNFGIALKVLERVTDKLLLNNQLNQYNTVFLDQLKENVIEEFFLSSL